MYINISMHTHMLSHIYYRLHQGFRNTVLLSLQLCLKRSWCLFCEGFCYKFDQILDKSTICKLVRVGLQDVDKKMPNLEWIGRRRICVRPLNIAIIQDEACECIPIIRIFTVEHYQHHKLNTQAQENNDRRKCITQQIDLYHASCLDMSLNTWTLSWSYLSISRLHP